MVVTRSTMNHDSSTSMVSPHAVFFGSLCVPRSFGGGVATRTAKGTNRGADRFCASVSPSRDDDDDDGDGDGDDDDASSPGISAASPDDDARDRTTEPRRYRRAFVRADAPRVPMTRSRLRPSLDADADGFVARQRAGTIARMA